VFLSSIELWGLTLDEEGNFITDELKEIPFEKWFSLCQEANASRFEDCVKIDRNWTENAFYIPMRLAARYRNCWS